MSPLANAYRAIDEPIAETFWPLRALVCESCFLVQLEMAPAPEALFSDYAYLSSVSTSWLAHSQSYAEGIIERLALNPKSHVVEIASNDGYLLQFFLRAGISAIGVEPAANVAAVSEERGVPAIVDYFSADVAAKIASDRQADLVIANNVLAHVPDIHDFVEGIRILLAPDGRATFEFPHLLRLIERVQFDTIYHEHVTYLSGLALERILHEHGLKIVDVERLGTHGGSLRLHVSLSGSSVAPTPAVHSLRQDEENVGLASLSTYEAFAERVPNVKRALLRHLFDLIDGGRSIAAYGAPAKATTLFNYCGVDAAIVPFTVDASPAKQGKAIPGVRIPIEHPSVLIDRAPEDIWVLPWNLAAEVSMTLRESVGPEVRLMVTDPDPRWL